MCETWLIVKPQTKAGTGLLARSAKDKMENTGERGREERIDLIIISSDGKSAVQQRPFSGLSFESVGRKITRPWEEISYDTVVMRGVRGLEGISVTRRLLDIRRLYGNVAAPGGEGVAVTATGWGFPSALVTITISASVRLKPSEIPKLRNSKKGFFAHDRDEKQPDVPVYVLGAHRQYQRKKSKSCEAFKALHGTGA
ncbi:hypothetical protein BJV74DRAFT_796710 [Russula compacta]|nr:hypothetical protein BJV74DRAFT_796710 [Russula compacta]